MLFEIYEAECDEDDKEEMTDEEEGDDGDYYYIIPEKPMEKENKNNYSKNTNKQNVINHLLFKYK
jgi:hypothetical protein